MGARLLHIIASLCAVLLFVGAPAAVCFNIFSKDEPDAVSQATLVLPDEPSGEFVVLINKSIHGDTLNEWTEFFSGEYAVIFDDLSCLVPTGDAAAQQLAERFCAQLPENQMTVRTEDATLLASKLDAGLIDTAVFSAELAQALKLPENGSGDIVAVRIIGGENDEKA